MSVLDTSTRLLLDFYEHAPCGFHSLDPNGIFLHINDTELDWLGYCREEVVGRMSLPDVLSPEGRRVFERNFPRLKREGKLRDVEFEFVRKNGSPFPVLISATAVLNGDGKFAMCRSIVYDLSHRKTADVRFRCILEAASDAVLICNCNGIITLANGGVEKVFGYSKEELQGQPVENLIGEESRASHRELRRQFFSHPQSQPMGAVRSLTGLRKDGTRIPIEVNLSPIDTEEEHSALAVIRDVTDRRAAELELRGSEELYRSVVSAMAEGVVVQEQNGRITACNESAQRILGLSEDQILGLTSVDPRWKAIHEDGSPFPGETHPSMVALQTGQRQSNVCMGLQTPDGESTWILINAEPFFSPIAKERGVVTTFSDITDRKKLEEQLSRAQRLEALGRLAGGVAHDFNNILGIVVGHCDLMAEKVSPSDERIPVHIKAIRKSAEHAAALTRQLLAFSRKQVMRMSRLDLNEIVRNLSEMLKRLIGENIELRFQQHPEPGWINIDPVQIEQVVLNLVVNARDAMPNGGRVTISTANVDLDDTLISNSRSVPPGSYVVLSVSDTGHGMDLKTMSRLFEPFYTTKEMGRGTGLGLSIIYGIVRQSSGYLLVDSKPGTGSTFKVYLPRAQGSVEAVPAATVRPVARTRTAATILLVEDDPDLRELTTAMLARGGYTILSASTAKEALATSESYNDPIALMITDMMLCGGMDGCQLSEQIHSQRPDTKILIVSGYSESLVHRSPSPKNSIEFMEKPFSAEQLRERVRDILTKPV